MVIQQPNYKLIYTDLLNEKFPHKREICSSILSKKIISAIDIIELNRKIFGAKDKETEASSRRHHSYGKSDILEILDYQKKHQLNNSQLAKHFKISRNSISKWKKQFL